MIFDSVNESATSLDNVKESPYGFGIKAALMCVYENECNYNALMKSVGISELKYYNETGKDLFLNEAGAFSGFLEKAKAFFKKVIEKIKSIFKTFMAKINSFALSDKEFVHKYQNEILRKDVTDLEFTGYEKFKNGWKDPKFTIEVVSYGSGAPTDTTTYLASKTSDEIEDMKDKDRGYILGENSLTESEFRDELNEKLYGDKDTFDVDSSIVRAAITTISDTKTTIRNIEKQQKDIIRKIEDFIKSINDESKKWDTTHFKASEHSPEETKRADDEIKHANYKIDLYRSHSNALTILFGAETQAAKDCNRQAKALCVKVLGYHKKESATYSESVDDLFAGVEMR